jgi:hypothetical protein
MAVSLRFIPGRTIRWRERRFVVVDYAGMDAVVAREVGKRKLQRIPINEAVGEFTPGDRNAWTADLVSVPEKAWQTAVRRFKIRKPMLEIGHTERTLAKVSKIAATLGKHPSTIYRWIQDYERAERLSVFLRKERSDRGKSRLPNKVNAIIEPAIKKIYLTAEQPDVAAVIEEVQLQCFKAKIKNPHAATVRKTEEGGDHLDRDAQFRHINATVKHCLRQGIPVISVDTKKKELIGNYQNGGQQWLRAKQPLKVQGHDFRSTRLATMLAIALEPECNNAPVAPAENIGCPDF